MDANQRELVQGAAAALVLKVVASASGFAVSLLVARLLGPDGAGLYFLAVAVALVFASVGRFGVDNAVVRHVAMSAESGASAELKGVHRAALIQATLGPAQPSLPCWMGP